MWRTVGITFKGDGGHGNHGSCGQPLFQIVIFRLTFSQADPPAVIMDDDLDVIRIVEGGCATLERRVVEFPSRRSELPDEPVKIMPVFFVANAAPLRREIELIPPFEFSLWR